MSVRVSAVIISHDQPEWLRKTLVALESQTRKVDEIIAVDSSNSDQVFAEFNVNKVVRRSENNFSALVSAGAAQVSSALTDSNLSGAAPEVADAQHSWLWILHDDSVPEPDTLEKLLAAADLSPSVALLGPKQLDPNQTGLIVQQGITLTKLGGIFSLVDHELDQAQHDQADDVLAISTAGALIRSDLYRRLQGFDRHAPNFASDIDFSIRARLSGYRVVVVPQARIHHAMLSLQGKRSRRWLQGSPASAKRRAEIHLQIAYLPVVLAWLYALFLPLTGIARAFWRLSTKQPGLVGLELSTAIWGFFTTPVRVLSRSKIKLSRQISFSALWPLRASWAMVRHRNRMLRDHVADEADSSDNLSGSEASATSTTFSSAPQTPAHTYLSAKSFASAGGWFTALALLCSSWQFWPTNLAAVGGSFAPLSDDWLALAGRAGASWQNSGLGLAAPSDPFNWVLTAIGGLWFVTPSLALAVAVLAARSIAFVGAWHAAGRVTNRAWVKNFIGLSYTLWPSLLAAQQQARIGAILTWMLLPWLTLATSKLLRPPVGKQVRARQSSWVGVSGLLFAAVAVSAPSVAVIGLLALLVVAAARPKRLGVLIWVPALAATLYAPYAWFMTVSLGHPFAILSDPGLPVDSVHQEFWQVLASVPNGFSFGSAMAENILSFSTLVVAGLAIVALASRRALLATALLGFAIVAAVVGFVIQQSWFAGLGVHGSAAPASAVVALALLLASGLTLEGLASNHKRLAGSFATASLAALLGASLAGFGGLLAGTPALSFSDGRTVPAIVAAEAAQGSSLRLLKITQSGENTFDVQIVSPSGRLLESNSTAYRFSTAETSATDVRYLAVDHLAANLVSANGTDLAPAFAAANIGFVMVERSNSADLSASLNSVRELELVGQTDFGLLWRVKAAKSIAPASDSWRQSWSITKGIQLLVILIFLLLAIPSAPKRRAKNIGNIFIASDLETNDFESTGSIDFGGDADALLEIEAQRSLSLQESERT